MHDRVVVVPANGFVPELYQPMLAAAGIDSSLGYLPPALRGRPPQLHSWSELIDDLVSWLDGHDRDVVLIGHSVGGFSALGAAARRPGKVAAVIAFDPVLLAPPRSWIWGLSSALGLGERLEMVSRARNRQDRWSSSAEAVDYLAGKPLFQTFDPACRDLIADLLDSDDQGVSLRWPRQWEANIYRSVPARPWSLIGDLEGRSPLIVRGARSTTFNATAAGIARRHARVLELDDLGHLLPFEDHDRCASIIADELGRCGWH